ncbi:MAG TPA: phosphate acyltransferase PlsX, partial [Elusimicrobia bacterium]|nr:phosphate acyltransferase PlsX [Elusimicrobiota bacterium]
MRIAIDAMGGDFAPHKVIEGTVEAANEYPYQLTLVGDEKIISAELDKYDTPQPNIKICPASEVIGMKETPGKACRTKKDASIVIATKLVAENKTEAIVSAGNSGAVMAASLMYLGRLTSVRRPAIASFVPTLKGLSIILDVGANVDCKPEHLFQFAIMGNIYAQSILKKEKPRIALLSIGEEEGKGNELSLVAYELLRNSSLDFIGNIEGSEIPKGKADVIVCDGFVGNTILKFGEGLAEVIFELAKEELKSHPFRTTISGLLLKTIFQEIKKKTDYDEYGGAPLLGVNGICIIAHGKSNAKAIKNAIRVAGESIEQRINEKINSELDKYNLEKI